MISLKRLAPTYSLPSQTLRASREFGFPAVRCMAVNSVTPSRRCFESSICLVDVLATDSSRQLRIQSPPDTVFRYTRLILHLKESFSFHSRLSKVHAISPPIFFPGLLLPFSAAYLRMEWKKAGYTERLCMEV